MNLDADAIRAAVRRGETVNLSSWRACLRALEAEAALVACDWVGAARHAVAVLAQADEAGPQSRCDALRVLAIVRARRGAPEIWPLLDEAHELARGLRQLAAMAVARGEAAWLDGDDYRALAETEEAYRLTLDQDAHDLAAELARWRRRAGDEDVQATAGSCAYERALSRADGGDQRGLRQCFDELRALGAHGTARVIGSRLTGCGAHGLPRGPRRAARSNPHDLTVRELEVLRLLADGLRNADIAGSLYLSPKTVEHHVSSILRKLDAPNRTAAAGWLRQAA